MDDLIDLLDLAFQEPEMCEAEYRYEWNDGQRTLIVVHAADCRDHRRCMATSN
jgi:hypothetical protein